MNRLLRCSLQSIVGLRAFRIATPVLHSTVLEYSLDKTINTGTVLGLQYFSIQG